MDPDNEEINGSGSENEDDPTLELPALSESGHDMQTDRNERSDRGKPGTYVPGHGEPDEDRFETGSPADAYSVYRVDTESVRFELERVRLRRDALDAEVGSLKEVIDNLTEQLKLMREKLSEANESLKQADNALVSPFLQRTEQEYTPQAAIRSQTRDPSRAVTTEKARDGTVLSGDAFKGSIDPVTGSGGDLQRELKKRGDAAPVINERHELALLVELSDSAGQYPITPGLLSIGSSVDNDICIKSAYVSHHHAEIVSSKTRSVLRDLDSTNGTYVNSRRIWRHALSHGDSITIGKHWFRFVTRSSDTAAQDIHGKKVDTRST